MSVRRATADRRTLYRVCGGCGRSFCTTADTPWLRSMEQPGKRYASVYFCSASCYADSYKQRQKDPQKKKNDGRKYYAANREKLKAYAMQRRRADPGAAAKDSAYARRKRKLLMTGDDNGRKCGESQD